jgi:hypothetical protein
VAGGCILVISGQCIYGPWISWQPPRLPLELASFTSKRQDTQALHLGFSVRAGRLSLCRAWGCAALWPISSILSRWIGLGDKAIISRNACDRLVAMGRGLIAALFQRGAFRRVARTSLAGG